MLASIYLDLNGINIRRLYNNYNTTDEVLIFSFLSPERSLNV